ncbi:cupin-like domain-containing protein [Alteromonas aestuariivivens]|uniref:Cupin-like domain-containing protein n=1 Tax=Alteromonas aestuariivivens TaxID=1938339 RepID=A0A3D8M785_9ALTE|nr:cupin-like domain-containing protein [Alteromonas aestuariivivens]RDV25585.1 cupin-like domain-containing protein [Alteromonas aestuariivivens]
MFGIDTRVKEICGADKDALSQMLVKEQQPVILRGLVSGWPLVEASRAGPESAVTYLKRFYNGKRSMIYQGPSEIRGRYFYNEQVSKLNYESHMGQIDGMLDSILATLGCDDAPSLYVASNAVDSHFPAMRAENDLTVPIENPDIPITPPLASIWIGNRSLASCHFDSLENIACCVAGRRRFVLFPPGQIANLYPGPLEMTPGGQAISMVDFYNPDFARYPNFRQALSVGQVAELKPGDAIYIPTMWWHQVEGLNDFNILINYWWSPSAAYLPAGMGALLHAMLGIRDKSAAEKAAWKTLFDYYVFGDSATAAKHLPPESQGILGPMDELKARRLRSLLLNQLNR